MLDYIDFNKEIVTITSGFKNTLFLIVNIRFQKYLLSQILIEIDKKIFKKQT